MDSKWAAGRVGLCGAVVVVALACGLKERQLAPRSPVEEGLVVEALERDLLARHPAALPMLSLPELAAEGLTFEAVVEETQNFRIPIVIRGGAAGASGAWTLEGLGERHGGDTVVVKERFAGENGTTWWTHVNRTLGTFVDALARGDLPAPTIVLGMRIMTKGTLSAEVAAPVDDLFRAGSKTEQLVVTPAAWDTFYHNEPGVNVYKVVTGRKLWRFVAPSETRDLCPRDYAGGALQTCLRSLDEPRRSDVLARIPQYEVEIGPGDVLVNVPWWWHRVSTLCDEASIAVAQRRIGLLPLKAGLRNAPFLQANFLAKTLATVLLEKLSNALRGEDAGAFLDYVEQKTIAYGRHTCESFFGRSPEECAPDA